MRITVVFDATQGFSSGRKKEGYRGVEVIYSKQGETADEVMIETIRARRAGLVVVTFDRAIIDEAKKHAVPFITPARLEAALTGGSIRRRRRGQDGEKGQPPKGAEGGEAGQTGSEKIDRGGRVNFAPFACLIGAASPHIRAVCCYDKSQDLLARSSFRFFLPSPSLIIRQLITFPLEDPASSFFPY